MDAAKNLGEFLTGKLRPFQEAVKVKEDCVYDSLVESLEENDHCCISNVMAQFLVTQFFSDRKSAVFHCIVSVVIISQFTKF